MRRTGGASGIRGCPCPRYFFLKFSFHARSSADDTSCYPGFGIVQSVIVGQFEATLNSLLHERSTSAS